MKSQDRAKEDTRETKSEEKGAETQGCCPEGMPEMMANCYEAVGKGGSAGMAEMMQKCCGGMKKACRWVPLVPVVLAGVAFLLGYYLSPELVRVFWLIVSGFVALLGFVGLTIANAMCRA